MEDQCTPEVSHQQIVNGKFKWDITGQTTCTGTPNLPRRGSRAKRKLGLITQEEFESRRQLANASERKRQQTLTKAMDDLRACLPLEAHMVNRRKLSKFMTLKLAISYIEALTDILKECDEKDRRTSTDLPFSVTPRTPAIQSLPATDSLPMTPTLPMAPGLPVTACRPAPDGLPSTMCQPVPHSLPLTPCLSSDDRIPVFSGLPMPYRVFGEPQSSPQLVLPLTPPPTPVSFSLTVRKSFQIY